jgi:O-antigen ligase
MPARARLVLVLQAGLLLATVLVFVSPMALPDPLQLGAPLSWAVLALAVSAVVCGLEVAAGRWPATKLDWLLAAYLALVALTAITSVDRWETLKASLPLAAQVGLFYAAAAVARREPAFGGQVLLALILGASVVELIALAYHVELGLSVRPTDYPIPVGWSGYPELGALAALLVGVLAGALLGARRPAERIGLAALVVITCAQTLFLYSRGAWAAVAAIGVAAIVFAGPRRRALLLVGVPVVLVAGALALTHPTVRFLVNSMVAEKLASPTQGVNAAPPSARFALWQRSARMIADHPLHGVGLGNFRSVFEARYNPELNTDRRRGVHAHNLWLHTAGEVGIPAGILYLAIWGGALWLAGRTASRRPNAVTLGLLLASVGAFVTNLTDNVAAQTAGMRVFLLTWMLFGLVAGIESGAARDDHSPPR